MPEFVANGPIIPVRLLNQLDSGKVVFFCGAGISAGPGSELPRFDELVQYIYTANHMDPDAVEREALDLEEQDPVRRRPNFDKVLALLERPGRLGAELLRHTVIARLSEPATGQLDVHNALIDLSRNEQGVRLITTNFDNRFIEAGLDKHVVDTAPRLPVPKPHTWSSLVHLHGRIVPNEDGSNLVLTAADFGRAYLTERWAARFVTELFREFTVVFVGYSVGDPVIGYMVDALAAERTKGARFATAYAFADHDGSSIGNQKERERWLAKNVEPILYDSREHHTLLSNTLIKWAEIRSDPFQARSEIALNEIKKMPGGPDDPIVERVGWALQDPVAAKALADGPPFLAENDFAKVVSWLERFSEKGLLSCAPDVGNPGAVAQNPAVLRLVDRGLHSQNLHTLDRTRTHLARWMARHIHVPQLLSWVLRNGGHLHPVLRQEVESVLAASETEIPTKLRFLWTVLLNNEPVVPWKFVWTRDRYLAATKDSERRRIEDKVVDSIAPRLIVHPGPSSLLEIRNYLDNKPSPSNPLDVCGHVKLMASDRDILVNVEEILECAAVLSRHAGTLTGYLEQALVLATHDDDIFPDSSFYRPSITEHEENRYQDSWTGLIDLVRDSYTALAAADRARGDNLLHRWVLSRQSLFKRLALHALTENGKSDIRLARNLLVTGHKPGVWEPELRREVLRFFRLAGSRLPRRLCVEVVRAIHFGPKWGLKAKPPNYTEIIRREKALRLHKLTVGGVRLDKKSRVLAEEVVLGSEESHDEKDEFSEWTGEEGWIKEEELTPRELLYGSVADVVAALGRETVGRDGFFRFVRMLPIKAASALRRLSRRNEWPSAYWQGLLLGIATLRNSPRRHFRLLKYVAQVLDTAPDKFFSDVGPAGSDFVKYLSEEYGTDRELEVARLWAKIWTGIDKTPPRTNNPNDPLSDALSHPAGKLAEAALIRLWKYEPRTGTGLPQPIRAYFDTIGKRSDGQIGRMILAMRLHTLFAIDPDWARKHLIERLSPRNCEEAGDLWSAYSWSPNVGPDLLVAFKEPFLEILRERLEGDRRRKNLTRLFMTICLEAPSDLSAQEIRSVVEPMSEGALKTVLGSLRQRLKGGRDERAGIWRTKVSRWLEDYWPRTEVRNTVGTSEQLLDLLAESGDAFPDAAEWSLPYLRPLEENGLYHLGRNQCPEQHPDSVIQILNLVVEENVLSVYQRPTLLKILDAAKSAKPILTSDNRFQRLYRIATR